MRMERRARQHRGMGRLAVTLGLLTVLGLSGFPAPAGAAGAEPASEEPSPGPAPLAVEERVDAYVRPLAQAGELSGALLVAREGRVLYERAFGMASYELAAPNTPSTLFAVASITKPMTALVAIRLIEEGKLGLADPLARWIPGFPRGEEITVEHLLRHRSGIAHRVTEESEETVPRTAAEMVELAARRELLFEPGSQSSYSSAGYSVLARVLELAGGRPYGRLLEEIVLAPAGAVHSLHADRRRLLPGRALGHLRGAHGLLNAPLQDFSFLVGAGSVYSTPRDLLAIQQRLLAGGYGELARENLVREGGPRWNGATGGFRAFADHHAETGVTVIFCGNLVTGAIDLVRGDVPRIAAGEEVAPPEVPRYQAVTLTPAFQQRYEGIYQLRPGSEMELRFEGDDVRLGSWRLVPTSDRTMFSPQDYGRVQVVVGEDGAVEGLRWGESEEAPFFPRLGPLPEP